MEFKDVIQNRYSCKDFSTQQIEKEKLMEILEAGRVAPTAKNLQEQKIYVVQSKEYLDKIDACTPCRNPQEMKKALDLPENEEVVMMLDLGYGNQKEPLPNHHLKKELAETVKYL